MRSKIRVYDDGGKSIDRYTLVIPNEDELGKLDMWGFDENPFYPLGFGQYAGSYDKAHSYSHLGKLIPIDSLPSQAQEYVKQILREVNDLQGLPLGTPRHL